MFKLENTARVWLVLGKIDMRKAINGLSGIIANTLSMNPLSGEYFVFCAKKRNTIKILYWDKNGYCLWIKRLEQDSFRWPRTSQEAQAITGEQLSWLLSGLDMAQAHRERKYSV
jgi:transposase